MNFGGMVDFSLHVIEQGQALVSPFLSDKGMKFSVFFLPGNYSPIL